MLPSLIGTILSYMYYEWTILHFKQTTKLVLFLLLIEPRKSSMFNLFALAVIVRCTLQGSLGFIVKVTWLNVCSGIAKLLEKYVFCSVSGWNSKFNFRIYIMFVRTEFMCRLRIYEIPSGHCGQGMKRDRESVKVLVNKPVLSTIIMLLAILYQGYQTKKIGCLWDVTHE